MAQHPAHGDSGLAVAGELRPVFSDRRVEPQRATIGKHVDGQGRHAFAHGHHADERISLPWPRLPGVSKAAPQVDNGLSVMGYGDRGAQFFEGREVFFECRTDVAERRHTLSVHGVEGVGAGQRVAR